MNGVAHTLARVTPSLPSVSHLSTISIFSYQKKNWALFFVRDWTYLLLENGRKTT